jgi:hypothetical protein
MTSDRPWTLAERWAVDEEILDEMAAKGIYVRDDPSQPRWIRYRLRGYGELPPLTMDDISAR